MADKIDFSEVHNLGGYGSEFDSEVESEQNRKKYKGLLPKKKKGTDGVANKRNVEEEYTKEEGKVHRQQLLSLDAYARHKQFVNNYMLYYGGNKQEFKRDTSRDKRDSDVIRENHQFLWEDEDDDSQLSWERRLAKKYYDKLFKEYCIADLARYKENKFGMRWRIEKEVFEGKGQFICGAKKCNEREDLRSWEVNFGYIEQGEKKNALVKLRLCPDCSYKLNYRNKRKEVKPKRLQSKPLSKKHKKHKKQHKKHHKKHRSRDSDSDDDRSSKSQAKEEATETSKSDIIDQSVWSGPAKLTEEKSRGEEFDEYFDNMFL
ncbi:protein FRA10AC1 homolog [Patella vulgata]|uniref:protein FRA10AC1 homolog n=1 Tax=Patella vulgata TaxID=6465 RepID=UPI00218085C8|nr:protein FRA10AC1 homolog [Patella vulgata]